MPHFADIGLCVIFPVFFSLLSKTNFKAMNLMSYVEFFFLSLGCSSAAAVAAALCIVDLKITNTRSEHEIIITAEETKSHTQCIQTKKYRTKIIKKSQWSEHSHTMETSCSSSHTQYPQLEH